VKPFASNGDLTFTHPLTVHDMRWQVFATDEILTSEIIATDEFLTSEIFATGEILTSEIIATDEF